MRSRVNPRSDRGRPTTYDCDPGGGHRVARSTLFGAPRTAAPKRTIHMASTAPDRLRDELLELIRERERDGIRGLADRVGPAEWADLIPQLEPGEVAVLLQWLPDEEIPEIFEELDPSTAAHLLRTLSRNEAAEVLGGMRPEDADELRSLADYPPDSAGGLMTPEFVAVAPEARASEAIAAIRRLIDTAETVSYVYVIDGERHLLGVLSLYRLMLSAADTPVVELMAPTTVRVHATTDRETAARLLTDRNLLAIPVVDDVDRLLGIITEDDVADVLQQEATEDIERLGGSEPLALPYRLASVPLL